MQNADNFLDILLYLKECGEDEPEGYDLIDARIDDGETEDEDFETMLNSTISLSLSSYAPGDKRAKDSVQDSDFIKVRYAYVQGSRKHGVSTSKKQRPFCAAMDSARKIYRKEDILKMKQDGVNRELGHNKQPYSLWLHKGGVNCYHKWERRIYMKRTKVDGTPWGGSAMNGVIKVTEAKAKKKGFSKDKTKFKNDRRVAEAQIDRSDKGHHPSYVKPKKKK